ncbi:MAG: hypothetical protein K0R80_1954 [Clostridia bacterium]|jgi:ATP-dependent Zn protease|nr:hypothetical protein [Clostridia bacterium]
MQSRLSKISSITIGHLGFYSLQLVLIKTGTEREKGMKLNINFFEKSNKMSYIKYMHVGMLAIILIIGLVVYFTIQNNFYSKEAIYMVASHEAGHCLADEYYFKNSVIKVEINPASIKNIIKYAMMNKTSDEKNSVTSPSGKTVNKNAEYISNYNKREFYINQAICSWSGFEAARTLAYTDKMGIDAIPGKKKDEEEMIQHLLMVMKIDKIIPDNINSIDDLPNDSAGEHYYKLYDEVINKSKNIIVIHKKELASLTEELVKKRRLDGERIRELLKLDKNNS